jgi:hypothetical protein
MVPSRNNVKNVDIGILKVNFKSTEEAMKIDKDYMEFSRWFKSIEGVIHCGQWDDRQIAHAAWNESRKYHKIEPIPAQQYYVPNNHTNCMCVIPHQVYSIGTTVYCTICGKPVIGSALG